MTERLTDVLIHCRIDIQTESIVYMFIYIYHSFEQTLERSNNDQISNAYAKIPIKYFRIMIEWIVLAFRQLIFVSQAINHHISLALVLLIIEAWRSKLSHGRYRH